MNINKNINKNINENINNIINLRKKMSDFINSQNIIGTISGITIAVSAGNTIRSFVNELIFPTLYYVFRSHLKGSGFTKGSKASDFSHISYKHVFLFLKEFVTFICVLILTFYFVKSIMARLFILKPIGTTNVDIKNIRNGKETIPSATAAAVTISGTHS